jgi:hypothetical protein
MLLQVLKQFAVEKSWRTDTSQHTATPGALQWQVQTFGSFVVKL